MSRASETPEEAFARLAPAEQYISAPGYPECAFCGVPSNQLKRCACHKVAYCDRQCQQHHFSEHKKTCTARKRTVHTKSTKRL